MLGRIGRWARAEEAAIAPTAALTLFALVAAGGIAFDYARVAAMDTELQQAADQAALAAATQLDGGPGATARAVAAARNLLVNHTRFANDGGGLVVAMGTAVNSAQAGYTVGSEPILFYATRADAEANSNPLAPVASNDAAARFVRVRVAVRQAQFALTPVVGSLTSANINAEATAGLGSAICKVPPVMMCNPAEPVGNTNTAFPFSVTAHVGAGLRLVSVGNGNTAWAPGNFGYLDTNSSTANPNVELREALGWTSPPGECSPISGVETRTGAGTPVTQALNTRFDIYEKANTGNGNAASCPTGGVCPPSINTVKDVVMKGSPANGQSCGVSNNEWTLPDASRRYLPNSTTDLTEAQADAIEIMGHPRDKCHAISQNGSCPLDKIGDGAWDRNAYFRVNYGWTSTQWPGFLATGTNAIPLTNSTPTRYQVYMWEIGNRGQTIGGRTILAARATSGTGGNTMFDRDSPICGPLQTPASNGVVPGGTNVDRRRISAAVINCAAHNVQGGGNTVYPVLTWIELFLVEPSVQRDRTDANDVYAEIIGVTSTGAGSTVGQVVRRDVPYLVK